MLESKKPSQLIKKLHTNEIELKVHLLDDSSHVFNVKKRSNGGELIGKVLDYLSLSERDFFGVQIILTPNDDYVNWIDPKKPLLKYVTKDERQSCKLQFRVKFYVTDPSQLQEESTRHQFYLQIRRDIFRGNLECPLSTQYLLASYIVQAELGDFDAIDHEAGYLKTMKLIPNQTDEMEYRISEHHKLHRNQSVADVENSYLEHATKLAMYGIYFYKSKDSTGKDIELGVTTLGVIVYQNDHIVNEFSWSKMLKISFKRRTFFMELKRELSEDYDTILGFKMGSHKHAKAIWKMCVEYHSFFRLKRMTASTSRHLTSSSKSYFTACTEAQPTKEDKPVKMFNKTRTIAENRVNERALSNSSSNGSSNGNGTVNGNGNGKLSILSITKSYKTYDNKVTSKQLETLPRKAWEQQQNAEVAERVQAPTPAHLNDKSLITVCMEADEHGRFGFNVRGGTDFNMPVLVSRIAQHSPADRVVPKMKEGDTVLLINGHDVSTMTHTQIVQLIKATHEHNAHGQLVLTIKPNVNETPPIAEEEEPICQYVPDNYVDQNYPKYDVAVFTQSLFLLRDGLASGALLEQFEKLYKKNPHLSITEAKKIENLSKNRYRDILPYDCNRVVIVNSIEAETDYINGNYVNMSIPNDCVNRYIATQGPLANTVLEFWRMVQQESSNFIVMLTTIMERGRVKCHQYWPQLNEEMQLSPTFSIKLLTETVDSTDSYVLRSIMLIDATTGENRIVRQLQYLAWPDHGVPSDRTLFMNFVDKMREMRQENLDNIDQRFQQLQLLDVDASDVSPEELIPTSVHQYISAANPPIIVHCSAGIGRTGMLVLMDTALSFMNVNEPVYPLDIVKNMRDQRACMVQNVFQYKFICECIFAAYAKMTKSDLSD